MMKRFLFFILILMLVQLLTCTAFAADTDYSSGFGGFFSELFDTIGNAVESLINGIKKLFIPRQNYFKNLFNRIQKQLSAKFGGFVSTFKYLMKRFNNLRSYPNLAENFTIKFPANSLLFGYRVDLLYGYSRFFSMVRGAFTGFIALLTAAFAYKKITALINV